MGTGCVQAKADFREVVPDEVVPPSSAQAHSHPTNTTLPALLIQRAMFGYEEAKNECLRLTGMVEPQVQELPKPPTIEYMAQQIESTRTHPEVFAKHS